MPTSSQALILKNTDGALQPVFGRPFWHPSQSWMDLYTRNESIQNSFLFSKHPRRKSPQRRSETAPTAQNVRYDFSTLPELLKINGIRGSFLYDVNTNSLRLTVPSYQQTSLRTVNNSWCTDNTIRPTTLWSEIRRDRNLHVEPDVRRNVDDERTERLPHRKWEHKQINRVLARNQEMMKLQIKADGTMKMVKVTAREADYFRLVQESPDGVFRLLKTHPKDAGSFRLEGTKASEVGDFRLVPADGFECDDFRLVIVDAENRQYRLLQADPTDNKWFRSVAMSSKSDGEFRLVQAAVHADPSINCRSDVQIYFNEEINEMSQLGNWKVEHNNRAPPAQQQEMIKLQTKDDGTLQMVKVSGIEADYFQLIQESPDGVFRLVKSHANDKGSFRLEGTTPNDIGDFRLVPEDGFQSDDFRLVTVDAENRQFRLLKVESVDGRKFRSVAMSNESDGQFRLIQVAPRENSLPPYRYGKAFSTETESGQNKSATSEVFELKNTNISANTFCRSTYMPYVSTDNSMDNLVFFDNVMPQVASDSGGNASSLLPDINLYDSRNFTSTHRFKALSSVENGSQVSDMGRNSFVVMKSTRKRMDIEKSIQQGQSKPEITTQYQGQQTYGYAGMDKEKMQTRVERQMDPSELSWSSMDNDNDMDAFREKHIESYRKASPEVYDRLVSLGFRPTNVDRRQSILDKTIKCESQLHSSESVGHDSFVQKPDIKTSYHGNEWKTDNYEAWDHISDDIKARDLTGCVYN